MIAVGKPAGRLWLCSTVVASVIAVSMWATGSFAQDAAPLAPSAAAEHAAELKGAPPGENQGVYSDPLAPFNEAMFTFNLKLDDRVVRPIASGYSYVAPQPVRESVGRFFDNANVIPRFANNLFQLRLAQASAEAARFGINTTLGVVGLFDPADKWFGLKEHRDDFGLTIRYYSVATGPYVMLPFFGPSTVGDTVGLVVDGFMNPMSYLLPWYVTLAAGAGSEAAQAINYRSLNLNQFEEADRYAVDLYGAVQDAYLQTRAHRTQELHEGK